MPKYVTITPSKKPGKKMTAIFSHTVNRKDGTNVRKKIRTIHFGSAGMDDYTITKDKEQRKRYLDRHRKNENWSDAMTAGALSRWILWGDSTSITVNMRNFKSKFSLR